MGLIRKSLAVSSLGLVSGSSKKQRVAKATQRSTAAAAKAARATAAALQEANRAAAARDREEREFRYATDPVYRQYIDDKRAAAAEAERVRLAQLAERRRLQHERAAERRRRAGAFAVRITVAPGLLLLLAVLALTVWPIQVAVGNIRGTRPPFWLKRQLGTARMKTASLSGGSRQ